MHREIPFLLVTTIACLVIGCTRTRTESMVGSNGAVIELSGARFEIPAGNVLDSTLVRIEKRKIGKRTYDQAFGSLGDSYVIEPETLVFQIPIQFSYLTENKNACLGAKIGAGFVPLADAEVVGETLKAQLRHGGEYCLIEDPGRYGIVEHWRSGEGLLIVSDIYVGDYISEFKKTLRQSGYDFPVWTFVYKRGETVEANAQLLADELKNLHRDYGEFRLDVVSFGVGGLVTHRYLTDSSYYQRDMSPAVIAIGTPFFGSSFADLDKVKQGKSPFRFFYLDGMGKHAEDLEPQSEFVSLIRENRMPVGGHFYDEPEENKNFASLRGRSTFEGIFAEENDGDGLVSLSSTTLTWIEPEPFKLNHFALFDDATVHKVATDFVNLYRSFNWPMLFDTAWQADTDYSRIVRIWEREARLNYRGVNFDILLEHNMNMLRSTPERAILITNGDNDTYPAWLLQQKGFRNDVLIVNRSLFNHKEYVLFLQKKGLGLPLTQTEIDAIEPEKKNGAVITRSDKLIRLLIEKSKRQVVFSTTVYAPERYGFPLTLSGLVYETGECGTKTDGKNVDIEKTVQFFHEIFTYERISSVPFSTISKDLQGLFANYAGALAFVVTALKSQGKYERALEEIEFAKKMLPDFAVQYFSYAEAAVYLETNEVAKADSLVQILAQSPDASMTLKIGIAEAYHKKNMNDKAIKVLAGVLQDDPGNKEVLKLIRRYQGE